MKILYVGNYRMDWSTETYIAATLQSLGHEVIRCQEDQLFAGQLPQQAFNAKADLVLWTTTKPGFISLRDIEILREHQVMSVSLHLDLFVPLPQRRARLRLDPFWRTDHVFTADGDPVSAEVFRSEGINHHWLKPGVWREACVKGQPRDDMRASVIFLGTSYGYHELWSYRLELIEFLEATYGGWFRIYGRPHRTVYNQDLNDALASAAVVVGDTLCPGFVHENYWSDRVYEVTGRGGFIIHPRIKGLEQEFIEHEEIAFYNYGDFGHLKKLIDWYLANPDYREAVRNKGMARTKEEHTYLDRMQEMLGVLGV